MKGKSELFGKSMNVLLIFGTFLALFDSGRVGLQLLGLRILDRYGSAGNRWITENEGDFRAWCILGGLLLVFVCLFKFALSDGFLKTKKEVWKKPIWHYLVIFGGTAVIAYVLNYLFTITGFSVLNVRYQHIAESQYNVSLGFGLLMYGLASPFVEEMVFRGFIYGAMKQYMSKALTIFLSALLFGIYHGNIVQGVYGLIMGILFALVYEKYRNFYLAVIMHAIVNVVGYFIQLYGFI